jgi:hypothetical protein
MSDDNICRVCDTYCPEGGGVHSVCKEAVDAAVSSALAAQSAATVQPEPVAGEWAWEPCEEIKDAPLSEGALMGVYMTFDRHADKAWKPAEYLLHFAEAVQQAVLDATPPSPQTLTDEQIMRAVESSRLTDCIDYGYFWRGDWMSFIRAFALAVLAAAQEKKT